MLFSPINQAIFLSLNPFEKVQKTRNFNFSWIRSREDFLLTRLRVIDSAILSGRPLTIYIKGGILADYRW